MDEVAMRVRGGATAQYHAMDGTASICLTLHNINLLICKIGVTQAARLQTSRHTLCRGGQLHGHPSTHSPANSTDTLRSSPCPHGPTFLTALTWALPTGDI